MRVAIVTLHRVYNYGSVLQAYATQEVFEKRGHDTKIIDYITPQRTKWRLFWGKGAEGQSNVIYRIAKIGSFILKEKTFGRFVRTRLNLTKRYVTADDLQRDPPEADLYVTGSDQTWNSQYNEGIDRGFFLDFLPDTARRIAFVSSFGKTELDKGEIEETKRLLRRYEKISVREDSAVKIITDMGLEAPTHLMDPTLMLDKEEWLKIASPRLVKEPYLILMLLYNEDNHATEYARKIADEKGLKLVKISWEMKKPPLVDQLFTHRSPADFLSLFYYADFVVTNSFHGLAFSLNLEKQFVMVPRNEFNSRIESLLRLVGQSDRLVASEKEARLEAKNEIDYKIIKELFSAERQRTYEFLDSIEGL
jgi:hypothetical protein